MPAPDLDRRDEFHTALEESVDLAGLNDNDYRRLGARLISKLLAEGHDECTLQISSEPSSQRSS